MAQNVPLWCLHITHHHACEFNQEKQLAYHRAMVIIVLLLIFTSTEFLLFLDFSWNRQFSEAGYKEFRQQTLEEAAMAAARSGAFTKLQLLCERHPQRLVPGMLALLACLPETASHEVYSQLLSLVSSFSSSLTAKLISACQPRHSVFCVSFQCQILFLHPYL